MWQGFAESATVMPRMSSPDCDVVPVVDRYHDVHSPLMSPVHSPSPCCGRIACLE